MQENLEKNPKRINGRQISLGLVLIFMIIYAGIEYGIGGGIFLAVLSGLILWMFYSALSTENNIPVPADDYSDAFDFDANYDPMFSSLDQNIYHRD